MRIAIVGHAGSPIRGSEPGITWGWAWHLAEHHEVWLVNFPEFRTEVEQYLAEHPNDRFRVVWVDFPRRLDPWRPDRSSRGLKFKVHYILWLANVQRVVACLVKTQKIDIVHQVGLMTVSAPSKLWRLPAPFVWGPIGGGEVAPLAFRGYYGKAWNRERNRRWRIWLVKRSRGLRLVVRHARYLLTVNRETEAVLLRAGADPARLLLAIDSGVSPSHVRAQPRSDVPSAQLTLLWAGMLEGRKALPILLEALSLLSEAHASSDPPALPVRLLVAGDGPERTKWERYAQECGVAHFTQFLGRVESTRMASIYESADVFVFTSLQDAFGTVVLEALTHALPTIVLNHQGCAAVLPDDAAIKIPVTKPKETVAALAAAIDDLRRRPQKLRTLSEQALVAARQFEWPARASAMTKVYEQILGHRP